MRIGKVNYNEKACKGMSKSEFFKIHKPHYKRLSEHEREEALEFAYNTINPKKVEVSKAEKK